jgi:hypothetical protein
MTIQRMRFTCCINKAPDAHSEYVIIIAVPREQWLREGASVFAYVYTAWPIDTRAQVRRYDMSTDLSMQKMNTWRQAA